jgi:hypothetical protein
MNDLFLIFHANGTVNIVRKDELFPTSVDATVVRRMRISGNCKSSVLGTIGGSAGAYTFTASANQDLGVIWSNEVTNAA